MEDITEIRRIANKHSVLTREQEVAYILDHQAGIASGTDMIVKHNIRLVISQAKHYTNRGLELSDLIQLGCIGLIYAAGKFDCSRGLKFSTFATHWVRQKIVRGIEETAETIRKPNNIIAILTRIKRVYRGLVETLRDRPNSEQIAEAYNKEYGTRFGNIDAKKAWDIGSHIQPVDSIDEEILHDDDTLTVGDYLSDANLLPGQSSSTGTEENVEQSADRQLLMLLVQKLPENLAQVITFRYGLLDDQSKTLPETARALGLTVSEVTKIERKAIKQLKALTAKPPDPATKLYNVVVYNYMDSSKWVVMEAIKELRPDWTLRKLAKAAKTSYTFRKVSYKKALSYKEKFESEGATVEMISR